MANDLVVVTDYDPEWPTRFRRLAVPVREALGDIVAAVEHVGSTSVPGLAAKPMIDIAVVVGSVEAVPVAIERLETLGYQHEGNLGIPGREAFRWPPHTDRHHLYVVVQATQPCDDDVGFRDYIREHPDIARDYAELKKALAELHRHDRDRYTEAKSAFIARVLAAART